MGAGMFVDKFRYVITILAVAIMALAISIVNNTPAILLLLPLFCC